MNDGEARPLVRKARRPAAEPRHRPPAYNGLQRAMIAKRTRCLLCNGRGTRRGYGTVLRECERCRGTGRDTP